MARNSRRSSAAVSRREREPEQQSRTEKGGAGTSRAGQSNREQGSRGKATVHEFPARKDAGREAEDKREQKPDREPQRGSQRPQSGRAATAETSRDVKSRFAGNGKAAQQGWAEQKSKSRAQQQGGDQQQGSQSKAQRGKLKEPKPPFPAQHQPRPGLEAKLQPKPRYEGAKYRAAQKLKDKVALITGGDSGIGRAVAVLYAREGSDVAIVYLPEEQVDADETKRAVEAAGRECLLLPGDVTDPEFCEEAVERTVDELGKLDILVNNAAFQQHQ